MTRTSLSTFDVWALHLLSTNMIGPGFSTRSYVTVLGIGQQMAHGLCGVEAMLSSSLNPCSYLFPDHWVDD